MKEIRRAVCIGFFMVILSMGGLHTINAQENPLDVQGNAESSVEITDDNLQIMPTKQGEFPRTIEEKGGYDLVEFSEGQVIAVLKEESSEGEITAGVNMGGTIRASVGHTGRLGVVKANGWQTIVNDMYAEGKTAFCAERANSPVSSANHFNSGVVVEGPISMSILAGMNNQFGDLTGQPIAVKKVVTQAAVWHFEGSLPAHATVIADGVGDVSHYYRSVIKHVKETNYRKLAFNKRQLKTMYDEKEKILTSEPFQLTQDSIRGKINLSITSPFYITKDGSTSKVTTARVGDILRIKTKDISTNRKAVLRAKGSFRMAIGRRYSHAQYPELQDIVRLDGAEERFVETTVPITATSAKGSYIIQKEFDVASINKEVNLQMDLDHISDVELLVKGPNGYKNKVQLNKKVVGNKIIFASDAQFVLPGNYTLEETQTNWKFVFSNEKKPFVVRAGEQTDLSFTTLSNKMAEGTIKIEKDLLQNNHLEGNEIDFNTLLDKITIQVKSLEPHIIFDKTFKLNKLGKLEIPHLPVGMYEIREIIVPDEMTKDETVYTVNIGESNRKAHINPIVNRQAYPDVVTITNKIKRGSVAISKKIVDPSTDGLSPNLWQLDAIQISIINKTHPKHVQYIRNLSKDGKLLVEDLPYGLYEVKEHFVPDHMEKDDTVHEFLLNVDGQHEQFVFTNKLSTSEIQIIKKNDNGDLVSGVTFEMSLDIERTHDGRPIPYKMVEGKVVKQKLSIIPTVENGVFYRLDDKQKILQPYTTESPHGSIVSGKIPLAYKHIYVQEVSTPTQGYLHIDNMPKLVRLKKDKIVQIEFLNFIKVPGMIEIKKVNEDGKKLSATFDVLKKTETGYTFVETILTHPKTGIGRSTILDMFDAKGKKLAYYLKEHSTSEYKQIELLPVTDENWQDDCKTHKITVVNTYKRVYAELWKHVEKNQRNLTAKGVEFTWFNKQHKKIGVFRFSDNGRSILEKPVRVDKLLGGSGTYIKETKAPKGIQPISGSIPIMPFQIEQIKDLDVLKLNAKSTSIENKILLKLVRTGMPSTIEEITIGLSIFFFSLVAKRFRRKRFIFRGEECL